MDDTLHEESSRFWELVHPGGPGGLVMQKPEHREQDAEAIPCDGYAVVFFPRITALGTASVAFYGLEETFSRTPEAAISKFLDRTAKGQTWETYADAGHRVRKVRVVDIGDAESGNPPLKPFK